MTTSAAAVSLPTWTLRPMVEGDMNYVLKTWVGSDGWHATARMLGPIHRLWHTRVVQKLLRRRDTTGTIAAVPDDEAAILGWSVTGPGGLLYYVYARKELRRIGMARALIAHLPQDVIFTHLPVVRGIQMPETWTYNPYLNTMVDEAISNPPYIGAGTWVTG